MNGDTRQILHSNRNHTVSRVRDKPASTVRRVATINTYPEAQRPNKKKERV